MNSILLKSVPSTLSSQLRCNIVKVLLGPALHARALGDIRGSPNGYTVRMQI